MLHGLFFELVAVYFFLLIRQLCSSTSSWSVFRLTLALVIMLGNGKVCWPGGRSLDPGIGSRGVF